MGYEVPTKVSNYQTSWGYGLWLGLTYHMSGSFRYIRLYSIILLAGAIIILANQINMSSKPTRYLNESNPNFCLRNPLFPCLNPSLCSSNHNLCWLNPHFCPFLLVKSTFLSICLLVKSTFHQFSSAFPVIFLRKHAC